MSSSSDTNKYLSILLLISITLVYISYNLYKNLQINSSVLMKSLIGTGFNNIQDSIASEKNPMVTEMSTYASNAAKALTIIEYSTEENRLANSIFQSIEDMIANIDIIDTDYNAWICFYIQLFLSPRLQQYWSINDMFYDNKAQYFIKNLIDEIKKIGKDYTEWNAKDIVETSLKIKIRKYS